jgi:hypothetical protein
LELTDTLRSVNDAQTFLRFVQALIDDRKNEVQKATTQSSSPYGPGPNGWENGTIETFLEAAMAWAKDSGFAEAQTIADKNPWREFAQFLYMGKIYE